MHFQEDITIQVSIFLLKAVILLVQITVGYCTEHESQFMNNFTTKNYMHKSKKQFSKSYNQFVKSVGY